MSYNDVIQDAQDQMHKAFEYLEKELKGIRTGRASSALVEFIKVEAWGSLQDIRSVAMVSVPETTQIVIKPYDGSIKQEILKAIQNSDLGLNGMVDGDVIRVNVPPPSADRRKQLSAQVGKLGEEARVSVRNVRRDTLKAIGSLTKDQGLSEDDQKRAEKQVEDATKGAIAKVDTAADTKSKEIEAI